MSVLGNVDGMLLYYYDADESIDDLLRKTTLYFIYRGGKCACVYIYIEISKIVF